MKEKFCKKCGKNFIPDHPRRLYHIGECQRAVRGAQNRAAVARWRGNHAKKIILPSIKTESSTVKINKINP